jgi:hypothetical protein
MSHLGLSILNVGGWGLGMQSERICIVLIYKKLCKHRQNKSFVKSLVWLIDIIVKNSNI